VLRLYREEYFDFNVRHVHEKLVEEHGIELNYTCVKLALHGVLRNSSGTGGLGARQK